MKLEVGTKVVITNGINKRNGTVVAKLYCNVDEFDIIVTHESFGSNPKEPVSQAFSSKTFRGRGGAVQIEDPIVTYEATVYADANEGIMWSTQAASRKWRDEAPKGSVLGFLTGECDTTTMEITKVRFISLR